MSEKRRFNIVDILIVLVLAIVIAAACFLLTCQKEQDELAAVSKTVVFEAKEKTEEFCSLPKEGDIIWEGTKKVEFGRIKSVDKKPATTETTSLKDGTMVKAEIPDLYDLYLTIEVTNPSVDTSVGKMMWINSRLYKTNGYVIEAVSQ